MSRRRLGSLITRGNVDGLEREEGAVTYPNFTMTEDRKKELDLGGGGRRSAHLLLCLGRSAHPEQGSYRKLIPLAKNRRDTFRGINPLVNHAIADRRVLFVPKWVRFGHSLGSSRTPTSPSPADIRHVNQVVALGPNWPSMISSVGQRDRTGKSEGQGKVTA
jgi:hypothetical protein